MVRTMQALDGIDQLLRAERTDLLPDSVDKCPSKGQRGELVCRRLFDGRMANCIPAGGHDDAAAPRPCATGGRRPRLIGPRTARLVLTAAALPRDSGR